MPIRYIYAKTRRSSLIEGDDGTQFEPKGKPAAGYSAETRFFSPPLSSAPQFVVKRPKYAAYYSRYEEHSIQKNNKIDAQLTQEYERERDLWNLFYPEKKAILFSDGGPRLILPYLPGHTLSQTEIPNRLTRCQIALAIARAFKKLHAFNLYYNDLNDDNILIEKRADNTFEAHLIDFGGVGETPFHQEQGLLNRHIRCISNSIPQGIDNIIQYLLSEINTLVRPRIHLIFQPGGHTLFSRYVDGLREETDFSSWWQLNEQRGLS